MALMCKKIDINVWEVIEAAKTKPFGFMPFYPGPGIGGHCIPLDPHYLGWKMKSLNFEPRFIELAGAINSSMPHHVINMLYQIMDKYGKTVSKSKFLIIGVSYKPDISDVRESPSLDVITLLSKIAKKVDYYDPYVPEIMLDKKYLSVKLKDIKKYDCAVIVTAHSSLNWKYIVDNSKIIFDTRNAVKIKSRKVYKL
jgi:UDP-N-acetyl-D-glucosamine dehydrogenase